MKKVLLVSHNQSQCGVYQYGQLVMMALKKSTKHQFIWGAYANPAEFWAAFNSINPDVVIYNYHVSPLGWANLVVSAVRSRAKQLLMVHEPGMGMNGMDGHISLDPNIKEDGYTFSPGWFIINYENAHPLPTKPTFGSFGFGFPGKGFERLIETVQEQFDDAHIRLGLAYAFYGDADGNMARATAERCRQLIHKPGITLEVSHDLLEIPQLVDWLGQNSINVFLYEEFKGRGLSSVPIYAMSSRRPIALTKSYMFRHVNKNYQNHPSIFVEDSSLKAILENGMMAVEPFYEELTEERFIQNYERMIDTICQ